MYKRQLIGRMVPQQQWRDTRELIYNYLDLCNEQVFLRSRRRIRTDTWRDWAAGIRSHLQKPCFQKVWLEVKEESPGWFSFLERLEQDEFEIDPVKWR